MKKFFCVVFGFIGMIILACLRYCQWDAIKLDCNVNQIFTYIGMLALVVTGFGYMARKKSTSKHAPQHRNTPQRRHIPYENYDDEMFERKQFARR